MKRNIVIVTIIVIAVLLLDQFIKIYVKLNFDPGESHPLIGSWFIAEYIENQGMAFGTTFGSKIWHKLALSLFRIGAISALVVYMIKQLRKGVRLEFLIAASLVLAGATGNLIDSMFYDFAFPYDPCMAFNHLSGSGIETDCGFFGTIETRNTGFLFGNVVDMFKFHAYWPSWVPYLGDSEVFPAIWNVADASIFCGVVMVFIRQKTYFPKVEKDDLSTETINEENRSEEN